MAEEVQRPYRLRVQVNRFSKIIQVQALNSHCFIAALT